MTSRAENAEGGLFSADLCLLLLLSALLLLVMSARLDTRYLGISIKRV